MEGGKPLILREATGLKKNQGRGKPLILKSRRIMKGENPLIVSMIAKENQNKPKSK